MLCIKSELHLNQDGVKTGEGTATLPVKDLFKQIIAETNAKVILTIGTSGSVFDEFELGDVVVTRAAKFRLQNEFRNEPRWQRPIRTSSSASSALPGRRWTCSIWAPKRTNSKRPPSSGPRGSPER